MRRVLSMSALLSSLLAAPAFAGSPAELEVTGQSIVISPDPDERAMIKELHEKLLQNRPADVHHMRAFNAAMTQLAQAQLAQAIPGRTGDFPPYGKDFMPGHPPFIIDNAAIDNAATIGQFQRTEKACFLGVTTSPVTATLREQLGLAKGMGLVVDFVEKDSPAATSGLQVHDILQKLDDQLLINAHQLAVLVRSKKPGDTVTLTVIRAAKPVELKAKLAEKELPVLESEAPFQQIAPHELWRPPSGLGQGLPPGWEKSIQSRVTVGPEGGCIQNIADDKVDITIKTDKDGKGVITVNDKTGKVIYNGPYTSEDDKKKVPAEIADKIKDTQSELRITITGTDNNRGSTITRADAEHIITVTQGNGTELTVKEVKTGKMIYDGPANTDDDLKNIPKDVRDKVTSLQKNTTIHLEHTEPNKP